MSEITKCKSLTAEERKAALEARKRELDSQRARGLEQLGVERARINAEHARAVADAEETSQGERKAWRDAAAEAFMSDKEAATLQCEASQRFDAALAARKGELDAERDAQLAPLDGRAAQIAREHEQALQALAQESADAQRELSEAIVKSWREQVAAPVRCWLAAPTAENAEEIARIWHALNRRARRELGCELHEDLLVAPLCAELVERYPAAQALFGSDWTWSRDAPLGREVTAFHRSLKGGTRAIGRALYLLFDTLTEAAESAHGEVTPHLRALYEARFCSATSHDVAREVSALKAAEEARKVRDVAAPSAPAMATPPPRRSSLFGWLTG